MENLVRPVGSMSVGPLFHFSGLASWSETMLCRPS
ncbi:rCG23076 [Rattus norvegicus]|uniref:RCG23076 n=1 Tax=Rattus norvegicus TaxID=10116 RepID=A6KNA3_RAT|nr:rCG23076 [Rattus norvegicus]